MALKVKLLFYKAEKNYCSICGAVADARKQDNIALFLIPNPNETGVWIASLCRSCHVYYVNTQIEPIADMSKCSFCGKTPFNSKPTIQCRSTKDNGMFRFLFAVYHKECFDFCSGFEVLKIKR
jgi:hypothetical protein